MKGDISMIAINTPDVQVVDFLDIRDLFEMLGEFGDGNIGRSFFEKNIKNGKEVLNGVPEDETSDKDGEDRIEIGNVGETHNNGADENDDPAENVLEHVEIDGFLVE